MPYKDPINAKKWRRINYLKHKEDILRQRSAYYYKNWEACQKRRAAWRTKNPEKVKIYVRRYAESEKGKRATQIAGRRQRLLNGTHLKARGAVRTALARNDLNKSSCKKCGDIKVEAHHFKGYQKKNWLKVKWLCRKCHRQQHV